MKGLLRRLASAAVLIPLLAAVIFWAPWWMFSLVVLAVTLVSLHEWFAMHGRKLGDMAGAFVFSILFVSQVATAGEWETEALVFFLVALPAAMALMAVLLRRPPAERLALVGETALSLLFIAFPLSFFIVLRGFPSIGTKLVVFLLLLLWIADTAAFAIGVPFGRHKMSPLLSPKKSYEGLAAALIAGTAAGCFLGPLLGVTQDAARSALIGLFLSVLGQLGDLFESLWKRARGVKDSSALIPGHGGVLDRIDSFLLTAPALYYLLMRGIL